MTKTIAKVRRPPVKTWPFRINYQGHSWSLTINGNNGTVLLRNGRDEHRMLVSKFFRSMTDEEMTALEKKMRIGPHYSLPYARKKNEGVGEAGDFEE